MFDHIPYEKLCEQVEDYQRFRVAAQPGTTAYGRICDGERALREVLATRPEHLAAQAAWRGRVATLHDAPPVCA